MRKVLSIVVLAAGLAVAGTVSAQSVGTNVGQSMNQPMVVTADNGKLRMGPNATAKILTTVPHGQTVTMIGTANGGAWAHVIGSPALRWPIATRARILFVKCRI
jgi:uncharacterized protein YgiM (DUF1202 family)